MWMEGRGCLSWQVLNESYVNALRRLSVPAPKAQAVVEAFALWRAVEPSLELAQRAWLLSEDFQAGRKLGGAWGSLSDRGPRSPESSGAVRKDLQAAETE
jgi:uncharacterized protein YecT (DUF1311 family)